METGGEREIFALRAGCGPRVVYSDLGKRGEGYTYGRKLPADGTFEHPEPKGE